MQVKQYISGGAIRCVQSSFRMIVLALTGEDPGEEAADRMTGYVEGRGTWQFRMLLALADYGLHAVDHEKFNVREFIDDPVSAIREQFRDEAAVQSILDETDLAAECEALASCVQSPFITFIESVPTFDDLSAQIAKGRLVMVNVNLQVLEGKSAREGHILILENIDGDTVVAHDPGPNGGLGRSFPRDLFQKAWQSPSIAAANYISVGKGSAIRP